MKETRGNKPVKALVSVCSICLLSMQLPSFAQNPVPVEVTGPAWAALPAPNPLPEGARLKFPPPRLHFPDPPSPTNTANFLAVAYQNSFDNYWPDVAGAVGTTNTMVTLQNSV